jgi:HD-GYP domain-containing protein (c-di-GMP phosphodiesterase class II)
MHPEIAELQSKLKEILYDCAVEIRATKAALYLYDGNGRYEMITEYGFRGEIRQIADRTDPIIDRCGRGRNAFFVNGLAAEPRFSELMYESGTERLLAAPVYLRGQLVGVIDMRDKAGKQPFDANDAPKALRIADRVAELFTNKNVFNLRYITLSEMEEGTGDRAQGAGVVPATAPPPVVAETPPPATPPPVPRPLPPAPSRRDSGAFKPRLASIIIEARTAAERIVVPTNSETLSETELGVVRDVLRSMLLIPGAVVASFSAFGHLGGVQETAARTTLADDGEKFLQSKLNIWLTKRGEGGGFVRTNVTTPFGTTAPPIAAAQLLKVFTAPVAAGSMRGLYLTVGFAAPPDRTTHELLAAFLGQLQLAIEHSMGRGAVQAVRARMAEKLLEPDFTKHPELRRHSEAVAVRAEAFARFLALSPSEVENVRLAAIVHDCGMRLLDYDKLYRKRDLSSDEMHILREHVAVGAVLVEPILGAEIARIVLCHHERVDGRGYPNELHGDDIPLLSRVLQLCDAYETMIAPESYEAPQTHESAMAIVARGAGSQFDGELARRFAEMMRA